MDAQTIVLTVAIILLLLVILAFAGMRLRRSRELRARFGPEYDRAVRERGGRLKAESDLGERERRHDELHIRPLEPVERERYAQEWANVQERFVDEPVTAAAQADRLVTALMSDRGYPTDTFETRTETLSVEHADTLQHYRTAHDIVGRTGDGGPDGGLGRTEETSTEKLRQAMTHYRELFDELLEPVHAGGGHAERHAPAPGLSPDAGRGPAPGLSPDHGRGPDPGLGPDHGRGPDPGTGPSRRPGPG